MSSAITLETKDAQIDSASAQNQTGTDSVQFLVYALFVAGLGLAFYNGTWTLALTAGVASVIIFLLLRTFAPAVAGYGTSFCLGLLCSQITFQMKEIPHVALIFFVASAALIYYNNWRVLIPVSGVFLVHQFLFYILVTKHAETADLTFTWLYVVLFFVQIGLSAVFLYRLQNLYRSKISVDGQYKIQSGLLQRNIELAKQIASGNFDSSIEISDDDVLGKSLSEMSKNLKAAAEENQNRNWTMAGIARIAEIIRVSNHKMEDLANQIVSYLVKYLNATQGGIFVINDANPEEKFLELKGCYAYDRKKYLEKKVEIGEGLIGQAVLERETMYLTDVPQDYLNITSGLGEANPNAIIIVPLKTEEDVVGALEIASFNKFADYQREFLEKVSENIASSIIFTKNQDRTSKLLEDSQVLAEQLRAQEEEMRQNMEELQATQEDVQRKNIEMENTQNELMKERFLMEALMKSAKDMIYFKDLQSRFIRVSHNMALVFGKKDYRELIGKSDFDFFTDEHARPAYEGEQEIIRTGKPIVDLIEKETWEDGRESYVSTTKMLLQDLNGNTVGTFGISRDVSKIMKMEAELLSKEKLYSVILKNSSEIYTSISADGLIKYQSPSYFKILQQEEKDMVGMKVHNLVHPDDAAKLQQAIDDVQRDPDKIQDLAIRYKTGNGNWHTMRTLLRNYLQEEGIKGIILVGTVVSG